MEAAKKQLANDDTIPDATRSLMIVLMLIITLMAKRLGLNSSNSSKPPSSDPNRKKKPRKKTGKKPGGQKGHKGHLITCRKHDISPTTALDLLFQGKLPDFDSYLTIFAE